MVSEILMQKSQTDVQYLQFLLETMRDGLYVNGRLTVFCTALANNGKLGWMDFIDSIVESPSIPTIISNAKRKLGHTFKSIEDVYRAITLITENDVFETIINILNTENVMPEDIFTFDESMSITAGKDQTDIYFALGSGKVPLNEQRIIIRELKKSGYYDTYHMTVTPDMICLKF